MSKSNIKAVEQSGGKLSFNRVFELTVSDQGTGGDNIDFTAYTFEDTGVGISHITIMNDGGTNDVYFVFDALGSTITTTDPSTYNGKCYHGTPYNEISFDGNATSVGFRCASTKSTTVKVMVW
jgi:hypothetical protein